MSCAIFKGVDGRAFLFCNTSEHAFGPLFKSAEEAEDFMDYVREFPDRRLCSPNTRFLGKDPREYTDAGLSIMHATWLKSKHPRAIRETQKFTIHGDSRTDGIIDHLEREAALVK